ncbi:hypothetical protein NDU88_000985 [Pleurodeles waltl]|uniref:Uncharacterized protein n=1 Tax=Pleurodeles waltl TaxID=8319 RepID=A0AAV7UTF4_PLEWA|nr:hypothetical protein NDU88_000985 [Pleurodeles waltl]
MRRPWAGPGDCMPWRSTRDPTTRRSYRGRDWGLEQPGVCCAERRGPVRRRLRGECNGGRAQPYSWMATEIREA